jgi:hypothetical protein
MESVANVVLPAIGRNDHADAIDLWVINAYLLSLSAPLLLGGAREACTAAAVS